MNRENYRKYLLSSLRPESKCKCIISSNYDIPKNCPAFLLTEDIYVIGYDLESDYGIHYLPVFDYTRSKTLKKIHDNLLLKIKFNILTECGFPHVVSNIIIKNLRELLD